jgi:hypothetical protein
MMIVPGEQGDYLDQGWAKGVKQRVDLVNPEAAVGSDHSDDEGDNCECHGGTELTPINAEANADRRCHLTNLRRRVS